MTPTTNLRFIERTFVLFTDPETGISTGRKVKILQQWWSGTLTAYVMDSPNGNAGEWRDVPLEAE